MLYNNFSAKVICGLNLTDDFPIQTGVKQCFLLSPLLFSLCLDWVMTKSSDKQGQRYICITEERLEIYQDQHQYQNKDLQKHSFSCPPVWCRVLEGYEHHNQQSRCFSDTMSKGDSMYFLAQHHLKQRPIPENNNHSNF